jgi:septum formation protein
MYLTSYEHAPAQTVSAIYVLNTLNGKSAEGVDVCKQHFNRIPDDIVEQVLDKGIIFHCSGGFMIDEPLLQPYLGERAGTEDSILGLDMELLKRLMDQVQ